MNNQDFMRLIRLKYGKNKKRSILDFNRKTIQNCFQSLFIAKRMSNTTNEKVRMT